MQETDRIHQQMKQAFVGVAWHGPSVMEILEGVDAEAGAARPLPDAHSIWEIVLHLTSTQDVLLSRLRGVNKQLSPAEDWPPVPEATGEAWGKAVSNLKSRDEKLREAVAAFPVEKLDTQLVDGGSSAYNNFHGYVQHNLYHAAQIVMLKKMAGR
jgi:hypothetical protein